MSLIDRRALLRLAADAVGGATVFSALPPAVLHTQQPSQKPPALDMDLVRRFVVAAHTKLDETRAMLDSEPRLINATLDWGGGDFETALGGAAHMGRPDIANLLLERGARLDVFCAAMLGKLEVVRACLADTPSIHAVKGPHGISLLRHAQAGKQDAMVKLLMEAGAK